MPHGQGHKMLVVAEASDLRDCPAGRDFLHKRHAAADLATGHAANVESQVDFLEIAIAGQSHSQQPRVEKQKAHEANERFAVMEIELAASGDKWLENRRVDLPVDHRQELPAGREENAARGASPRG